MTLDRALGSTVDTARTSLLRMFAFLALFGILIFSWCVSGNCYFGRYAYQIVIWSLAVFAALGMLVYAKHLSRSDRIVTTSQGQQRLSILQMVGYVIGVGCLVGWMCWLVFFALMSLLVFVTSNTTHNLVAELTVLHTGGHCGVSYRFYDAALQREISECVLPYGHARSGDMVKVFQKVGPLGLHLDGLSHL